MVADYIKDIDMYRCKLKGKAISNPYLTKCKSHQKEYNKRGNLVKLLYNISCKLSKE